jgi:hypothetical protein
MKRDYLIFFLIFLLFLSPQLLRYYSGDLNIIGYPTYRLARVSELFLKGEYYDPLSYQGSWVIYPPGHFMVLGTLSESIGLDIYATAAFFGPFVGALASIFIYKLSNKRSLLVFALTPITVYLFSHAGSRTLPFLFGVVSFYLYRKSRKRLSTAFLLLCSVAHPEVAAAFLLITVIDSMRDLREIFASGSVIILPYLLVFLFFGLPTQNSLHTDYSVPERASLHISTFEELVSLFNNPYAAVSLPILLLVIYSFRKYEKTNLLALLAFFTLSILLQRFRIYLGLVIALFVASSSKDLKKRTFALLLVLTTPYVIDEIFWMSSIGPSECFISLMPEGGMDETTISNWAFGHWIETLAGTKTFLDGSAEYVPEVDRRFTDFIGIYTFGNSTSVELLESNSIDYLLLLDSDIEYFTSRDLTLAVEQLNLRTLKSNECGTLYRTG